ncbi:MBL fold metallo-hydrolase [Sesbania bispinosa]|nr:MBL fold metallo-hydrolase [Sesbania bispinosa]
MKFLLNSLSNHNKPEEKLRKNKLLSSLNSPKANQRHPLVINNQKANLRHLLVLNSQKANLRLLLVLSELNSHRGLNLQAGLQEILKSHCKHTTLKTQVLELLNPRQIPTRKADTASNKGAHTHKRGKKKTLQPGPSIPIWARNMLVGQLVTQLTQVWQKHVDHLKQVASLQATELGVEQLDPSGATSAEGPNPTLVAAPAPTDDANDQGRNDMGESKVPEDKGGRKG